jgi:hypothetical protein
MKQYTVEKKENPTKFGDVQFAWTEGDNITKFCTQHSAQPAIFFEELLQEAGYTKVDVLANCSS